MFSRRMPSEAASLLQAMAEAPALGIVMRTWQDSNRTSYRTSSSPFSSAAPLIMAVPC